MTHDFDREYWERHWQGSIEGSPHAISFQPPNPYLIRETAHLTAGSALDAGCGAGAETTWLALNGWQVTAADVSSTALERTAARVEAAGVAERVQLVEADLSQWTPDGAYDLVMSHYAHPAIPQLDFYERIAAWVRPGGTLLLVGHLHTHGVTGHDHQPPQSASVTARSIIDRLGSGEWRIETADELTRVVTDPHGRDVTLHDVVIRATRGRPLSADPLSIDPAWIRGQRRGHLPVWR